MNTQQLCRLGWRPFFQQQLSLEEWETLVPARLVDCQRSTFTVRTESAVHSLAITPNMPAMTVGDWILLDTSGRFVRLLERETLFQRKASGPRAATQLIAANTDTVFIVCSANLDFSLNRIERYLALAHEAGVETVVVLSKADLCDNPDSFVQQVKAQDPLLAVVAVNGLDPRSVEALSPWCGPGKTVAFLGSSGVGKSTLVNTLLGRQVQATTESRADDDEGRHTTTSRSLHLLPGGGLLLDTPGMRELQLTACEDGIGRTFSDIAALSSRCRFQDCRHQTEPGCAVLAALEAGNLDQRRLTNYRKLVREQALNSATLSERRARDRKLGKMYRQVKRLKERAPSDAD